MTRLDQPVAEGDLHVVQVVDEGTKGDGVAFIDGLAVFVPGTTPGDNPLVRIKYVGDTSARAEVVG